MVINTSFAKKKVIVALSGGVDSAVCCYLLQKKGFSVSAIFMRNWESLDGCNAIDDCESALSVAEHLNIDFEVVNFSKEYQKKVFEQFLIELKLGRTPNPDVLCNSEIKFRAFLDHAIEKGDYIATGHYAKIYNGALLRAKDPKKDQSYFLSKLDSCALEKVFFPLGEYTKEEVKKIAAKISLPNAQRKESMGICFIGPNNFNEFIGKHIPDSPGDIVSENGHLVGKHKGLHYHTIGQRKGLGIGGHQCFEQKPWFVAKKDLNKNRLIVVQDENHPLLQNQKISATQLSLNNNSINLCALNLDNSIRVFAQTRYRQTPQKCSAQLNVKEKSAFVQFDKNQQALTPGQVVAFYHPHPNKKDQVCLGCAIIDYLL